MKGHLSMEEMKWYYFFTSWKRFLKVKQTDLPDYIRWTTQGPGRFAGTAWRRPRRPWTGSRRRWVLGFRARPRGIRRLPWPSGSVCPSLPAGMIQVLRSRS
jgi:hypothetical protein